MTVRLHDSGQLDPTALFFIDTWKNNPHCAVFGQGIATYPATGEQYAAWYGADRQVRLARRSGWGQPWSDQILTLPISLGPNDSHNTIALGVSAGDQRLHVCAGGHAGPMQYTRTDAGLLNSAGWPWPVSAFSVPDNTLAGTPIGEMTYPTFTPRPDGGLLFWWRNGGSSNGRLRLGHYDTVSETWEDLGDVTSSTGVYTASFKPPPNTSDTRGFYWAPPQYSAGRLHLVGVWREFDSDVLKIIYDGVFANHHVVYVWSDDDGATWYNNAGTQVATTGTDPIAVGDPGILVDAGTDTRFALQVSSFAVGPGVIGYLPDYVRGGEVGSDGAVSSEAERVAKTTHVPRFRVGTGTWFHRSVETGGEPVYCQYPSGRAGRGHLVFGPSGDAYVFYSGLRVWRAAAPNYTTWTLAADWSGRLRPFGEAHQPDTSRISEGLVSFLYGEDAPAGAVAAPVCVRDFEIT